MKVGEVKTQRMVATAETMSDIKLVMSQVKFTLGTVPFFPFLGLNFVLSCQQVFGRMGQ